MAETLSFSMDGGVVRKSVIGNAMHCGVSEVWCWKCDALWGRRGAVLEVRGVVGQARCRAGSAKRCGANEVL